MNKNQVIKKNVDIFDDFVKSNFIYENNYYIFNHLIFKKIVYEGQIDIFLKNLKKYYYKNKYFYIERPSITHNQFNTILRQICKKNKCAFKIDYLANGDSFLTKPEKTIYMAKSIIKKITRTN